MDSSGMMEEHREIIRKNYTELAEILCFGLDAVCDNLYSQKIFSKRLKDEIMAKKDPTSRATHLLDLIVTRGPSAFNAFHAAIQKAELFHAAAILKPQFVQECNGSVAVKTE